MTDKERREQIVSRLTAAFIIEGNFGSSQRSEDYAVAKAFEVAAVIMAESDRLEAQTN